MVIGVPCMPLRIFVVDIEAEAFSRGVDYMVEKKERGVRIFLRIIIPLRPKVMG